MGFWQLTTLKSSSCYCWFKFVCLQLVLNLFSSYSLKWMRRSSWAPGLKSRGWKAAAEEPRPVTQVRLHVWTDPPTVKRKKNVHHAAKNISSCVINAKFQKWLRAGGLLFTSLAQISLDAWLTLHIEIWVSSSNSVLKIRCEGQIVATTSLNVT